ncbi:hypothetical protein [Amycolatopsis nalaikhensis]|uniref:Uncharacterized protein n=1 Tax=Amycolatopsis nalaikhensis TaxID=715472 RepID=A0ABY8XR38_9PSEU|nr:hypothetical protein [Amycolatopsis sp. 2-2]WIV58088.1 hypothetical protein QP939_05315 [Amycolatopsis sp. 2-2]
MNPLFKPLPGTAVAAGLLSAAVLVSGLSAPPSPEQAVARLAAVDVPGDKRFEARVDADGNVRFYQNGKQLGVPIPPSALRAYADYDSSVPDDLPDNYRWDPDRKRYLPRADPDGDLPARSDERKRRTRKTADASTEHGAPLGEKIEKFTKTMQDATKAARQAGQLVGQVPGKPAVSMPVSGDLTLSGLATLVGLTASGVGNWVRNRDQRAENRAAQGKVDRRTQREARDAPKVVADAKAKEQHARTLAADARRLARAGHPEADAAAERADVAREQAAAARAKAKRYEASYVRYHVQDEQKNVHRAEQAHEAARRDVEPAAEATRESSGKKGSRIVRDARVRRTGEEAARHRATLAAATKRAQRQLADEVRRHGGPGDPDDPPKTVTPKQPTSRDGTGGARQPIPEPATAVGRNPVVPSRLSSFSAMRSAVQVRAGMGMLQGVAPPYSYKEIHDNPYLPTAFGLAQGLQDAEMTGDPENVRWLENAIIKYHLPDPHKRKTFLEALARTYRPQIVKVDGGYAEAVNPIRTWWEDYVRLHYPVKVPTPRELAVRKQDQLAARDRQDGTLKRPLTPREVAVRKQEQLDRRDRQDMGTPKKKVHVPTGREVAVRKQEQLDKRDRQDAGAPKKKVHVPSSREVAVRKQDQISKRDRQDAGKTPRTKAQTAKTTAPKSAQYKAALKKQSMPA